MAHDSFSKEELIEQLKALANQEVVIPPHMGAMCYSPSIQERKTVKCPACGKQIDVISWENSEKKRIAKKVNEIIRLGYDAKIEELCADCATKLGLSDKYDPFFDSSLYCVFYFKTKDQEEYHLAISNKEDDYKAVVAFLRNEPSYTDYYDRTRLIKDELALIKRMTGISIE